MQTVQGGAVYGKGTLSSVVVRLRLFVSSFAPLWAITALRQERWWIALGLCLLTVAGVISALLIIVDVHRLEPGPYRVAAVNDRGSEVAGYLAAYLLPFVMVSDPSARELVAYGLFFAVTAVVSIQSDMLAVNPLLYLLGYRVAAVSIGDAGTSYLICRQLPRPGDVVHGAELGPMVILETKGAQ